MNLTLTRTDKKEDGIFGVLTDEQGKQIAVSLEHAYDSGNGDGSYEPKLQSGVYKCVRGEHRLHSQLMPFTTFEITGVVGHTGILFHIGNYNEDSNGCVLLGRRILPSPLPSSDNMITSSRNTFNAFMDLQKGVNEFTLTVKG